jgi:putative SOS response-associated peptidase YedK
MCGRFALTQTDEEKLVESFSLGGPLPALAPRYNIAPTQTVATVIRDGESGENRLVQMRWGLIPSWSKDPTIGSKMINARGETVHEKPSFRTALRKRRCLVIADGFYEWQAQPSGPKQPMFITLQDRQPFGMAGLYEFWTEPESGETVTTCTIITTAANELMAALHNRMPVIVPRASYAAWLNPDYTDPVQVMPLIQPYPADQMAYYPVSRRVNSVTNDDPTLIERVS